MDNPIFRIHVIQTLAEPCSSLRHGDERILPPGEPPHTCPYREELGDDYETLCTCCADCQHECAMDI